MDALQNAGDIMRSNNENEADLGSPEVQESQYQPQADQPSSQQEQQGASSAKPVEQREAEAAANKADNLKKQSQERRKIASVGDLHIMSTGISEKPTPVTPMGWVNERFSDIRDNLKKHAKNALSGRMKPGNSWRDVLLGDEDVMPHCVSIGSENLLEAIREPGSNIIDLVNEQLATPITLDQCLADINILVNAINDTEIKVVLSKGPVNRRESVQERTLRAHVGVGIHIHPTQLKAFNADFDGDEGDLLTDKRLIGKYNNAMSYLVDSEGKAVIDLDFFPLDGVVDKRKRVLDLMLEISFGERNKRGIWDRNEISAAKAAEAIVDDYIKCCNDLANLKTNWVNLLRKIDKVAAELPGDRNVNSSKIFMSLYDFAAERRGLILKTEWSTYKGHSNFDPPPVGTDSFVVQMIDYCDEIIAGREAPSEQEFARMYNKFYGEGADQKNVPFRLLADFAKAVNRSEIVLLGSDVPVIKDGKVEYISFHTLYETTCSVAHSKRIADRVHMGSHELRAETELRNNVFSEVGMPSDYANFKDFIQAFKVSYNRNARLMNISRSVFRGDMDIVQNTEYEGITKLSKIGKALVEIYGDKTMEQMFPVWFDVEKENSISGLAPKYRGMTLSKFVMNNRLSYSMSEVENRFRSGRWTAMDVVYLVADQRTAQTQRFKEYWEKMTEGYATIMEEIQTYANNGDWNNYMIKVIALLDLASPDMFEYFGMESTDTFIRSKWGQRLLAAHDADSFRSTWVSMMIEYRMSRVDGIVSSKEEYAADSSLDVDEKAAVLNALDMAYGNEMDVLGSSSIAWRTIVNEELSGNKMFRAMIEHRWNFAKDGKPKSKWEKDKESWYWNAGYFWDDPASSEYLSLVDFLKSDASYQTKMDVLSDLARLQNNYNKIMSFEMIGQLAFHPDRIHEGSPFDMDNGLSTEKKAIKASMERLDSFCSRSTSEARKHADKLVEQARDKKRQFSNYIRKLATDPGFLVGVDMKFAADAMASVVDKTYDDSEKIKQQEMVNGYFQSLSYQRSGGFYTHMQQVDNKLLNKIGYDQLTPIDIIRIIGDPDVEVIVYDQFGNETVLSRESICGGRSIDDVINWIDENPRMSYIFSRYVTNIDEGVNKNDDDGPGNRVTLNRIDNGFDLYTDKKTQTLTYRAFSLLNDRPKFLAAVSLVTLHGGNVQRNIVPRLTKSLNGMCNLLAYLASADNPNIEAELEKHFGLTQESILEATKKGKFDDGSGFSEQEAYDMWAEVVAEIDDCISVLRANGVKTKSFEKPKGVKWGIDPNSVVSYYDVRQQMSGARTATMIGVEGSETVKNINLKVFLRNRPDRFIRVSRETPEGEVAKLSKLTNRDLRNEIEGSRDGSIIIDRMDYPEELKDWKPSDLTLARGKNRQLTSTAKFFELKREKAAEEFNAKAKKFGIDKLNSITKFSKWTKDSVSKGSKLVSDIEDAYGAERNYLAAVEVLASALEQADADLGYIDQGTTFYHCDYMNLADLMLSEQDGVLSIRSLEQLSAACRNRLSDYAVAGGLKAQMEELQQIVDLTGTPADPMMSNSVLADTLASMRSVAGGGKFRGRRAARRHSSMFERSYINLSDIFENFENSEYFAHEFEASKRNEQTQASLSRKRVPGEEGFKYVPPTKEQMDRISAEAYKRANMLLTPRSERLFGLVNFKTMASQGYTFIGAAIDPELQLYPGPQNVVYFNVIDENTEPILERCKAFGITAAFSDPSIVPDRYAEDVMEGERGTFFVPFFDMMLNGADSDYVGPAPGQFAMDPSNVTTCVEDTTYEIRPGDATAHIMQELVDRVRVVLHGDEIFDVDTLFPNVLRTFPKSDYRIDLCSREEVQKYIVDQWDDCAIDIGIAPSHPDFYMEMEKMGIRVKEYAARFDEADNSSILTGEMMDDRIVGFAKIVVDGQIKAFAPIIPFHRNMKGKVPRHYQVDKFDFVPGTNTQFQLSWSYSGGILGQAIKFFEGIGASNKMMTSGEVARSRTLQNGLPVDIMYSTKSVASRLFASNKRINTMVSLMMIPRVDPKYSYNFAELADAFPGDTMDIKGRMLRGEMTLQDWKDAYPNIERFHNDDEIDAVVRFIVRRCVEDYGTVNPSVLLMTRTQDGVMWPMGTEFEAFMDTSLNFQNALMKLMYEVTKINGGSPLCPPNIDANSDNCLFKPVTLEGEDYGVLQMLVPHYGWDGEEYMVPENVYLHFGFFGDVFSGFGRLNLTASIHADDLNVASKISDSDLVQLSRLGRREMSAVDKMRLHAVTVDSNGSKVAQGSDRTESHPNRRTLDGSFGKTLALTGHRPQKYSWLEKEDDPRYKEVERKLAEYCSAHGIDTIISGMAIGFDTLGAKFAKKHGLKLVAAVPFKGQEQKWNDEQQARYRELVEQADKVVVVNPFGYSAGKLNRRNEWMVHNGDEVFALWDNSDGGTKNCVRYAQDENKDIAFVDPKSIEVEEQNG